MRRVCANRNLAFCWRSSFRRLRGYVSYLEAAAGENNGKRPVNEMPPLEKKRKEAFSMPVDMAPSFAELTITKSSRCFDKRSNHPTARHSHFGNFSGTDNQPDRTPNPCPKEEFGSPQP